MELHNEILTPLNVSPEKYELQTFDEYFNLDELRQEISARLAELNFDDLFRTEIVYKVVTDTEAKHLKALLREMQLRMLKPIGSIKRLKRLLFSHVSLLFGMCCSQSSLIISAFFGNSLSRIPSL